MTYSIAIEIRELDKFEPSKETLFKVTSDKDLAETRQAIEHALAFGMSTLGLHWKRIDILD